MQIFTQLSFSGNFSVPYAPLSMLGCHGGNGELLTFRLPSIIFRIIYIIRQLTSNIDYDDHWAQTRMKKLAVKNGWIVGKNRFMKEKP